ncbi:hypothetical protein H072_9050 [Dactylellina haptotyla CBS 200.50]|uniref:Uncharacterized protein n=1 Tax=Dactylellina haptotyla (strain CBS 200.50) TaxID=1284197 RepID=S8A3I0_DACHA|nr:hypothetical protein H072_9050 [Dactylellina haptotyla CBS 200.50]
MPLTRSEYLEKSDIFNEPSSYPVHPYEHVYLYEEPQVFGSDVSDTETELLKLSGTPFAESMMRMWAKFRESLSLEGSEAARKAAAKEFREGLRVRNERYASVPFSYDGAHVPFLDFRDEEVNNLDGALEEAMASSLVVEGEDEDKDPREELVKLSWGNGTRRNANGDEVRYLIEELESEIQAEYF